MRVASASLHLSLRFVVCFGMLGSQTSAAAQELPPAEAWDASGSAQVAPLLAMLSMHSVLEDAQPHAPAGTYRMRSELIPGAVPVRPHSGYRIRDARRAWMAPAAAEALAAGFDAMRALDPRAPRLLVMDASTRHGGALRNHVSHRGGLDVDLSYYRLDCELNRRLKGRLDGRLKTRAVCGARPTAPEQLDAARQWRLLSQLLETRAVRWVFVDYALQARLHEAAVVDGATAAELSRWFQYPRGRDAAGGVIRHADGHGDHLHVRFVGEAQGRARGTGNGRKTGNGTLTDEEAQLLRLLGDDVADRDSVAPAVDGGRS